MSGYTKRTTEDGKEVYDLTYKTPDILPLVCLRLVFHDNVVDYVSQFKLAENVETRKIAHEGFESRLAVNVPILDRALELRREIVDLLGYKTW